ncbi:hypothetical protein LCGC14_2383950, partial [marine sediment metagenome]
VGAKTKPKTASQLIELLKEEYRKNGKTFKFTLDDVDTSSLDDNAKKLLVDAQKNTPDPTVPIDFELESDETEVDTFECGGCGTTLPSQLDHCSSCGTQLNW